MRQYAIWAAENDESGEETEMHFNAQCAYTQHMMQTTGHGEVDTSNPNTSPDSTP